MIHKIRNVSFGILAILALPCFAFADDGRFDLQGRPAPRNGIRRQAQVKGSGPILKSQAVGKLLGASDPYPSSIGGNIDYEYISDFTVTQKDGYYTFTVKVICPLLYDASGYPGYGTTKEYVNVWIDWNGDYSWSSSERVMAQSTSNYKKILADSKILYFTVTKKCEATATGAFKARAMLGYGYNPSDPTTYSWAWGNVKDCAVTFATGELSLVGSPSISFRDGIASNSDTRQKPGCNPAVTAANSIIAGHDCELTLPAVKIPTAIRNDTSLDLKLTVELQGKPSKSLTLSKTPTGAPFKEDGIEYGYYYPASGAKLKVDKYPLTTKLADYGKKSGCVKVEYKYWFFFKKTIKQDFDYYLFYARDDEKSGKPMWYLMWKQLYGELGRFEYVPKATYRGQMISTPKFPDEVYGAVEGSVVKGTVEAKKFIGPSAVDIDEPFTVGNLKQKQVAYSIDAVWRTIEHEGTHELLAYDYKTMVAVMHNGRLCWKYEDDDDGHWDASGKWVAGDGLIASFEKFYHTDPTLTDTFGMHSARNWTRETEKIYRAKGDNEYYVRMRVNDVNANAYHSRDWSYPGAQSPSSANILFTANPTKALKAMSLKAAAPQSVRAEKVENVADYPDVDESQLIASAIDPQLKILSATDVTTDFRNKGLSFSVQTEFEEAANYILEAWLLAQDGTPLAKSVNTGAYETGPTAVRFEFPADVLAQTQLTYRGPYVLGRVTCRFNASSSGTAYSVRNLLATKDYSAVDCQPQQIVLMDGFDDKIGTDGLTVSFDVSVPETGDYAVAASFALSNAETTVVTSTNRLNIGTSRVSLLLPGDQIYADKSRSSYVVADVWVNSLLREDLALEVPVNWQTSEVDYRDFAPAEEDSFAIRPDSIDLVPECDANDGTGLLRGLSLKFQVDNPEAGDQTIYNVVADLVDANGQRCAQAEANLTLQDGDQHSLFFSAQDIRRSALDGPYTVRRLRISNVETGEALDRCNVTDVQTAPLSVGDFVRALNVDEEQMALSEKVLPDGMLAGFLLRLPVDAPSDGVVSLSASVSDANGETVCRFESQVDARAGLNQLELELGGSEFAAAGKDGPYDIHSIVISHSACPDKPYEAAKVFRTEAYPVDRFSDSAFMLMPYDDDAPLQTKKTATYGGVLMKDGLVSGTAKLSIAAFDAKKGKRKATLTLQPISGSKVTLSGSSSNGEFVLTAKGVKDAAMLNVQEHNLQGRWGSCCIIGSLAASSSELVNYAKGWSLAFGDEEVSGRSLVKISSKGVVSVSGCAASGTKVKTGGPFILGDGFAYVPVLTSVGGALVRIRQDGTVSVIGDGLGDLLLAGETEKPVISGFVDSKNSMVGVAFSAMPVVNGLAYPLTFSAKGLPSGMKINAETGELSGAPLASGSYKITVTAVSKCNKSWTAKRSYSVKIVALPTWGKGNFDGYVYGYASPESYEDMMFGGASLSVGKTGKISGKFVSRGTNWTFSASSYSIASETTGWTNLCFEGTAKVKIGGKTHESAILGSVYPQTDGQWTATVSISSDIGWIDLSRNVWKETAGSEELEEWVGKYTWYTLAGIPISLTLDAKGVVTMKGRFDGVKTTSCTASLIREYNMCYSCLIGKYPDAELVRIWNEHEKPLYYTYYAYRNPGVRPYVSARGSGSGKFTYSPAYGQAASNKTVTVTAVADKQSVFAYWADSAGQFLSYSKSHKVLMSDADVPLEAVFVGKKKDPIAILAGGEWHLSDVPGFAFEVNSLSKSTVTVKGLPAGIKLDKTSLKVSDERKLVAGVHNVEIRVVNVAGCSAAQKVVIYVPNETSACREGILSGLDTSDAGYSLDRHGANFQAGMKVSFSLEDLGIRVVEGWKLSVSDLPSGWTYKSGKITGTATAVGPKTVTFKVTKGSKSYKATATFDLSPLPDWAVGTFVGATLTTYGGRSEFEEGTVSCTVSAAGKISGSYVMSGDASKTTFSGSGFVREDERLVAQVKGKVDGKSKTFTLSIGKDGASFSGKISSSESIKSELLVKNPWTGPAVDRTTLPVFAADVKCSFPVIGFFRGAEQEGTVTLSFFGDGKVSGKFVTKKGTVSAGLQLADFSICRSEDEWAGYLVIGIPANKSKKIAGCCKYLYFEMFRDPADGLVHEVLIRDVYGFGFFNGKYW